MDEGESAVMFKINARAAVRSAAGHAVSIRRKGTAMSPVERAERVATAGRDLARAAEHVQAARRNADMIQIDTNRRIFDEDLDALEVVIERTRRKLAEYSRRADDAAAASSRPGQITRCL